MEVIKEVEAAARFWDMLEGISQGRRYLIVDEAGGKVALFGPAEVEDTTAEQIPA